MLRLILGAAGAGKTSAVIREIDRLARAGAGGLCLIVPEQYSYEAERELCALCGDGISLSAEVLSFSRFALRVAQETGAGGRTYMDGGGRLLCMSLALRELGGRLRLYPGADRDPRLQKELLTAVEELRSAGLRSEDLLSAGEYAPSRLGAKLRDLALCLEAYEAVLENGRADPVHRLRRLAETVGESSLGREGSFYIDGFTDFTGAELEVIEALLKAGAPVTVCLTCDGPYTDSEHFAPARAAASRLERMARDLDLEAEITVFPPETDSEKNGALRFFTDHIFSHTSQRTENDGGAVRLFTAPDMRTECELAASRALELIRRHGCRRSDVAVAVRGFEDYRAPLEEAFRLYGVPLFTAGRGGMLQKPIPAFIEAAFRVLQGGWDSQDVLNYIKTGLTGLDRREADLLCGYVTLWSVKGSVWTKAAPWKQHPEGFGRERTEESDALLLKIDGIRRRLAGPLIRLWGRERSQATVLEHAQALTDFFSEISLPDSLAVHAGRLEAAGLDRQAEEFSQLWGLVCRALTQMTELLGNQHMDREEFFKLYLMTLSQYDVSGIPVSADSVSAGELDRMRRRHIKHLIILGASDDRLPRTDEEAGILNQEDRQALSSLGLEIGQCADPLSRELSLIYNCVSLPSETLTVSYSETDGSGALSRPGLLIARAAMLFGLEPERTVLDKLRLSAPGPALLLAAGVSEAGGPGRLARAFFEESPSGRDRLEDIDRRAAFIAGSLSPERVEELYGKTLSISPTRADAFLSCRFSYFLRYGLRLNEREKADFEAPELGSYMHYILEKCVQEIALSPGFEKATQSLAHSLADKYTDLYIQERLGGLEDKSPRFVFLFNRLREPVRRVAWDMVRELSRSDFRPLDFELSFGKNGKLPSIELGEGRRRLLVSGVADRVDGYFQDGKLYLRVMDYKTGKKAFSLSDVWYGMGMQMLLYLFALEEMGVSRYGVEVVPAGVLYVPAKDAVVSAPGDLTEEELSAEKAKARRRSGLLLEDPELLQAMERGHDPEYLPVRYRDGELRPSDSLAGTAMFASLRGHVEGRLLELSDEITQGRVDAEPCYKSASDNACLYCAYKRVCRFDESRGKRRRLETIKPAEFWERLGGEGK